MRNYRFIGELVFLSGLLCFPALASAGSGESPSGLKHWVSPDEVVLPSAEKRKIIGTWYSRTLKCTRSIEQVGTKYYEVKRFSNRSGQQEGKPIAKIGANKFRPKDGSRFGDYYVIEKDGSLGIYDKDGLVDTLPKHSSLFPTQGGIAAAEAQARKPDIQDTAERKNKIKSQFSAWDGSHRNLERLIKDGMKDSKSYEHVETSYVDMGTHLIVKTSFRGKNSFGAFVVNTVNAKISLDGDILNIISQN